MPEAQKLHFARPRRTVAPQPIAGVLRPVPARAGRLDHDARLLVVAVGSSKLHAGYRRSARPARGASLYGLNCPSTCSCTPPEVVLAV